MAGIFQASLLLFLLQLIATTTTTTTSCEDWCRDNCDNCGEGENPCLYQRKCDSVCPCPQFNLVCLTSNVTLDLLEPRYESVQISLYQNETKSAKYELEDESVKTFVLNETSRPEEKMKVCLSHHRDHPVCRECTTSIPPAAAGIERPDLLRVMQYSYYRPTFEALLVANSNSSNFCSPSVCHSVTLCDT